MAVNYRCPNVSCRKVLQVPDGMRGKKVRCGYCKTRHKVPKVKVHRTKPIEVKTQVQDS
ncbi:MAG: hypothetical protein GY869_27825 [Planctomycetes bacterium]|nr:hypothetical protein [Planctomycetota bacterium]